jgi:hypothetical protein
MSQILFISSRIACEAWLSRAVYILATGKLDRNFARRGPAQT